MKTIRNKIILMTLLISFLVATGIGIYGLVRIEMILGNMQFKYANSMVNEMALEFERYLSSHKGYLEGQAKALVFFGDYSKSFMESFTRQLVDGQSDVLYAYFNTPTDEGHLTSSDGWVPEASYSWENKPWVIKTLETDAVLVGSPAIDSVTGHLVTVLRKGIYDEAPKGILNLAIALDQMSEILLAIDRPENSRAMVLYENGALIAHDEIGILSGTHESLPNVLDLLPGFDLQSDFFVLGDKTYVSAPMSDEGWTVWLGVPNAFLSSRAIGTIGGFFLIYALAGFFTIHYVRFFARRISDPIEGLTKAVKVMSEGDYSFELDKSFSSRNDEIGILSKAFEDMRNNINHRTMELQALYEEMAAAEETLRENYDELERYQREVEYYAFNSPLSGLPNKERLLQQFAVDSDKSLNKSRTLFVLSFKEYAHYLETLGQTIMEEMHKHLSVCVEGLLKDLCLDAKVYDLSLGRFALYCVGETASVDLWRDSLQEKLNAFEVGDSFNGHMTVIMGGYKIPYQPAERVLEDFIQSAEMAISPHYLVAWFDERMRQKKQNDTFIERELAKALERNQLYVVYQNKYDVDERPISSEALLRWKHDVLGDISPGVFIPLAEKTGLIDALDRFVIETVVNRQAHLIKHNGTGIPVAVNLSILELIDPKLVEKLNDILKKAGVSPENLILEITETAFSKQLDIATQNISQLKSEGYKIHLDDFGTGYSSLAYLNQFDIDAIKIDISFTSRLLKDNKVKSIVQSIIDLSKSIGAGVIAEGVEQEEQFRTLVQMGCSGFQGFYWGPGKSD